MSIADSIPHRSLKRQEYISFKCEFKNQLNQTLIQNIHIMGRALLYSAEVTALYKELKRSYLSDRMTTLKDFTHHDVNSQSDMLALVRLMNRDHARHLKQSIQENPGIGIQPGYTAQDLLTQLVAANDQAKNKRKPRIDSRTVIRMININGKSVCLKQRTTSKGNRSDQVILVGQNMSDGSYDKILNTIESLKKSNHSEQAIARAILDPFDANTSEELKTIGTNLYVLLIATEGARNNAAFVTHMMVLELIRDGKLSFEQALSHKPGCRLPMRPKEAVRNTQWFEASFMPQHSFQTTESRVKKVTTNHQKALTIYKDELAVTKKWIMHITKCSDWHKSEELFEQRRNRIEEAVSRYWGCCIAPIDVYAKREFDQLDLEKQTQLFTAIENEDLDFVKKVLFSGVDLSQVVQEQGYSILSFAIVVLGNSHNANEILRLLVLNPSIDKNKGGNNGKYHLPSPLITAIRMGKTEVAIQLINIGADINLGFKLSSKYKKNKYKIFTPQYFEQQKSMLVYGHSCTLINIENYDNDWETKDAGYTPLHFAAAMLNEKLVEALVKLGANRLVQGYDGETPYDLADGFWEAELRDNPALYWDANAEKKAFPKLTSAQKESRRIIKELLSDQLG
jgi:ankyrin repeat protein